MSCLEGFMTVHTMGIYVVFIYVVFTLYVICCVYLKMEVDLIEVDCG